MGLAPPDTQEGDEIAILFGDATPFILRKAADRSPSGGPKKDNNRVEDGTVGRTRSGGGYILVGEAYVHDLTNGQGLEMGKVKTIALKQNSLTLSWRFFPSLGLSGDEATVEPGLIPLNDDSMTLHPFHHPKRY